MDIVMRSALGLLAVIAVFVATSPVLEDKEEGLLGVASDISWFGLFVLVPAFLVLVATAAVRRLRAAR